MSSNHIAIIWFGDIDAPEPYEFIGSGGVYFANTGDSQFKSCGSSSKQAAISPESYGIFVCRFVSTAPDILGLVSALGPILFEIKDSRPDP